MWRVYEEHGPDRRDGGKADSERPGQQSIIHETRNLPTRAHKVEEPLVQRPLAP